MLGFLHRIPAYSCEEVWAIRFCEVQDARQLRPLLRCSRPEPVRNEDRDCWIGLSTVALIYDTKYSDPEHLGWANKNISWFGLVSGSMEADVRKCWWYVCPVSSLWSTVKQTFGNNLNLDDQIRKMAANVWETFANMLRKFDNFDKFDDISWIWQSWLLSRYTRQIVFVDSTNCPTCFRSNCNVFLVLDNYSPANSSFPGELDLRLLARDSGRTPKITFRTSHTGSSIAVLGGIDRMKCAEMAMKRYMLTEWIHGSED